MLSAHYRKMQRESEAYAKRFTKHLAALLYSARKERGFSLRALELESGVPRKTIRRIELGKISPKLPALILLADAMKVSWVKLLKQADQLVDGAV